MVRVERQNIRRRAVEARQQVLLGRARVRGPAERERARDVRAGHGGAALVAVRALALGHRRVDGYARRRDVDDGTVVGPRRADAGLLDRADADDVGMAARVVMLAVPPVVAGGEDEDAALLVEVVDRVVVERIRTRHVRGAPRVGRDARAVVRAIDQRASRVGRISGPAVAEGLRGHELDAPGAGAARDARDSNAVVRDRRDRPGAVRAVRVPVHDVLLSPPGQAPGPAVTIVNETVVVVVDAVIAYLSLVDPNVLREVRMVDVDARVDDLDHQVRAAGLDLPRLVELDRFPVRFLSRERGVVGLRRAARDAVHLDGEHGQTEGVLLRKRADALQRRHRGPAALRRRREPAARARVALVPKVETGLPMLCLVFAGGGHGAAGLAAARRRRDARRDVVARFLAAADEVVRRVELVEQHLPDALRVGLERRDRIIKPPPFVVGHGAGRRCH
mmetsp:Transcript_19370/g.60640  ORF Transcript_19370/g.60640 Transcript_19370/m.60640 type:complete len:449 (+) Transcript_19370:794-2140(+)